MRTIRWSSAARGVINEAARRYYMGMTDEWPVPTELMAQAVDFVYQNLPEDETEGRDDEIEQTITVLYHRLRRAELR